MEHENVDTQAREFLTGSDRQGRAVDYGVYSKMMRRSFERVRELRTEKFKFSDICRAYAKAGALPPDADPSSFRKAFRNEAKRRDKNMELEKRVADGRNAPVGHDVKAERGDKPPVAHNTTARPDEKKTPVFNSPAMRTPGATSAPQRAGRAEVKPDNTFTIRPLDPDDVEAMEAAEKERKKKLLEVGRKIDTGHGSSVIRLPDGSFEF